MPDPQTRRTRSLKATWVTAFAVATVSASGYFMGMRQNLRESGDVVRAGVVAAQAPSAPATFAPAPAYRAMAGGQWHPSGVWHTTLNPGDLTSPEATPQSHAARTEKSVHRNDRRAYDGAPPVVPHPVSQMTPAACALCHTRPTRIGDAIAPAMSHAAYPSCTQCHVANSGFGDALASVPLPPAQPPAGSGFTGKTAIPHGERAALGAPPVIPHPLLMRGECLSCHGPNAGSAMPTTHPERSNCLQCHATGSNTAFPLVLEYLEASRPPLPPRPKP